MIMNGKKRPQTEEHNREVRECKECKKWLQIRCKHWPFSPGQKVNSLKNTPVIEAKEKAGHILVW